MKTKFWINKDSSVLINDASKKCQQRVAPLLTTSPNNQYRKVLVRPGHPRLRQVIGFLRLVLQSDWSHEKLPNRGGSRLIWWQVNFCWSLLYLLTFSRRIRKKRRRHLDDDSDEDEERLQLPIVSYFALVVGYCSLGSLLFNMWERGAIW
jgi:hypothetical protein